MYSNTGQSHTARIEWLMLTSVLYQLHQPFHPSLCQNSEFDEHVMISWSFPKSLVSFCEIMWSSMCFYMNSSIVQIYFVVLRRKNVNLRCVEEYRSSHWDQVVSCSTVSLTSLHNDIQICENSVLIVFAVQVISLALLEVWTSSKLLSISPYTIAGQVPSYECSTQNR